MASACLVVFQAIAASICQLGKDSMSEAVKHESLTLTSTQLRFHLPQHAQGSMVVMATTYM